MKYVCLFNEYKEKNTHKNTHNLLNNIGSTLSEVTKLGLPIPRGFIITADAYNQYYRDNEKINEELQKQINAYISKLEQINKKQFGSIDNPLLFCVKCKIFDYSSHSIKSLINVGLTDNIVENISKNTNEFIWIWECYLYFIENYTKIVKGIELKCFKEIQDTLNNNKLKLTIEDLRILASKLKYEYKLRVHDNFPDNSIEQLNSIIKALFKSWNDNKDFNISKSSTNGPTICVQPMVFGNLNEKSGIGTIYTRCPKTGEKILMGNFARQKLNIINNLTTINTFDNSIIANEFPTIYNQLKNICNILEEYYKDMMNIDYVIENNELFIVQVKYGRRTAQAALKIANDFFKENMSNDISDDLNNIKRQIKIKALTCFDGKGLEKS